MRLIVICLMLIGLTSVKAQNPTATNGDYSVNPPDFTKMQSDNEMHAALNVVMGLRQAATQQYVSNLVRQIKQTTAPNEARACAIFLLGELRATNTVAIEILIDNINFQAPRELGLRLPIWGQYPAEEALIKIGQPVVIPILNHLPNETNQLRRQLMCDVLKRVCPCN